jgi:hypothetical protein
MLNDWPVCGGDFFYDMDLYYGEMDSFMETYGAEANWDNLGDWMSESNFVDCTSPDGAFDYFASWYGKGD